MSDPASTSSYQFCESKAYARLKELARTPFDMTKSGNLTEERIAKYQSNALNFKVLYGTERITDEVMEALNDLAKESGALDFLRKMQEGEVINQIHGFDSENRSVLHTATRDFFSSPQKKKTALDAAALCKKEVDKLKQFILKIDQDNRFTDVVLIGIGGSELGPKANFIAMQYLQSSGRRFHFWGNVDPDDGASIVRNLNLATTLVLVVSKSGTTLETLANELFIKNLFIKKGLDPKNHFVAITGQGSPMDDKTKYLESFYIWDWIGGRYSSTSMVGGVLLALAAGFEAYWDFLQGAHEMDLVALNPDLKQNIPLLLALLGIWNRNFLNIPTLAVIPYSQALQRYPAHIQQLDMESNGKHITREGLKVSAATGPIIWGEPGTNAQHSFYQLIHQGTDVVCLEFIGFRESQYGQDIVVDGTTAQEKLLANLFAQAIALATGQRDDNPNKEFIGNRPSHLILGNKLTPHALGALLAMFEHKVALQGFIWKINSFDQEGVQLGKVLASKILATFKAKREGKASTAYPIGQAFIQQLERL